MSTTRRQFLLLTPDIVAVSILPSCLHKVKEWFEKNTQSSLASTKASEHVLYEEAQSRIGELEDMIVNMHPHVRLTGLAANMMYNSEVMKLLPEHKRVIAKKRRTDAIRS